MKKVYLSQLANKPLKDFLKQEGWSVIASQICPNVDPNIQAHTDLSICDLGQELFFGNENKPAKPYPNDIIYNAAIVGKYFIHNSKYTDEILKAKANELKLEMIHVSQGYTKCNTLIVDDTSIIVSDKGMADTLKDKLDVLLIEKGHIMLSGYDYGFIGGASGTMPGSNPKEKTVIFNGNLEKHPDFSKITDFINKRGYSVKYFSEYPLTDIGSILFEK